MRIVHIAKDGALELRWMWLPLFIAQNQLILRELQKEWEKFKGLEPTPAHLDMIHRSTIDWLVEKHKIEGLREYLNAISNVKEPD